VKTPVLFLAVCGAKFMIFPDDVGDPSYFPTPLSDCLYHLSFRKQLPLSLGKSSKNRTDVQSFWPPIFGRDDPDFSTADC